MIRNSVFNVPFISDNTYAVWNSLQDRIIILSQDEYAALLENQPGNIENSRRQYFLQEGILTDNADEMRDFLKKRHADRQLRSLYFRILTTTACNARCAYCYERGFPVLDMDSNTAASVAQFIADRYREHPLMPKVTVEWFGGEPTLNLKAIQLISDYLSEAGIPFRAQMTSNGVLLTESLIQSAEKWNLRKIQITLDAADQEYEAIKGLPAGTYRKILENIDHCLSSDIRIVVRINYAGNMTQTENLINKLAARYSGKTIQPKLYISTIYGAEKSVPAGTMREVMNLNGMLIESGLMSFDAVYSLRQRDRCFASTPWGFTIMPDGALVNCSHNVSEDNTYGTVWGFDPSNEQHRMFLSDVLSEECRTCALIPICGGGCTAAQYGVAQVNHCIPCKNIIADILRLRLKNTMSL